MITTRLLRSSWGKLSHRPTFAPPPLSKPHSRWFSSTKHRNQGGNQDYQPEERFRFSTAPKSLVKPIIGLGAALVGTTVVVVASAKRDDESEKAHHHDVRVVSPFEVTKEVERALEKDISASLRAYLQDVLGYVGTSLATVGFVAFSAHKLGWTALWFHSAMPVALIVSIGSLLVTILTSPENSILKHIAWVTYNLSTGFLLSTLGAVPAHYLVHAGAYTALLTGAMGAVAHVADRKRVLWLAWPLSVALTTLTVLGFTNLFLPASLALDFSQQVVAYGGLTVFGLYLLLDFVKVIHNAEHALEHGETLDPINASLGIYLDIINVFLSILEIMEIQEKKKRKTRRESESIPAPAA